MIENENNNFDYNIFYEYHISPVNQTIEGCLLANLFNYSQNKISLLCSSSILIKTVTVNQEIAFFSRSSTQNEYSNLHIFFPSKKESLFWTPVPKLTPTHKAKKNCKIIIFYEIQKKNPSIIFYHNFICTTNYPFGITGWMPVFSNLNIISIKKLVLVTDKEGYHIIGPGKPILSTPTRKEFDLSTIDNLDLLSWAVGEMNNVKISGFIFYSIDQFDPSNFSFLNEINKTCAKLQKAPLHPFIILPNHFTQLEITTGFFILSSSLLEDYFDFPSFIPIPSAYHLVAAVSYGLAFDYFCRRFTSTPDMNWFLSGLISYASRVFLKSGIGSQGTALYDFINIQYLRNFDGQNIDLSSMKAASILSLNRWESNSPFRIKSLYVVHLISNLLSDQFKKPLDFPNAWPDNITKTDFSRQLSQITNHAKSFMKFWTKWNIVPIVEIEVKANISKELRSAMSLQVTTEFTNIKPIDLFIPASLVVFHNLGKLTQNVLVNFDSEPQEFTFSNLPKSRPLKSSKMKLSDGIYWTSFESKPHVPIVVHYKCPLQMLFNIVMNYDHSLITQHDALISLNHILMTERDTAEMEIIKFLSNLLTDNQSRTFFSLKCHALHILGNVSLASDIDGNQADASRHELISYFLDYIVDRETTTLQKLDLIHPLIVLSAFRAVSKLVIITEKFTSFDFLKTAMCQLASNDIGPGIIYCFQLLIKDSDERQIASLIPHLITFITKCAGNPPLMTAAIRIYSMLMSWYPQMVAEKIMISMNDSFSDHKLPLFPRIAVGELLFDNFHLNSFIAIFRAILKEFKSTSFNTSFIFIEKMMKMLNAKYRELSDNDKSFMMSSHDINEILDIIHLLTCEFSDSFITLFSNTKALFSNMYEKKWNKIQFPNGIISATPIDFNDEEIGDGLFSDDE